MAFKQKLYLVLEKYEEKKMKEKSERKKIKKNKK